MCVPSRTRRGRSSTCSVIGRKTQPAKTISTSCRRRSMDSGEFATFLHSGPHSPSRLMLCSFTNQMLSQLGLLRYSTETTSCKNDVKEGVKVTCAHGGWPSECVRGVVASVVLLVVVFSRCRAWLCQSGLAPRALFLPFFLKGRRLKERSQGSIPRTVIFRYPPDDQVASGGLFCLKHYFAP